MTGEDDRRPRGEPPMDANAEARPHRIDHLEKRILSDATSLSMLPRRRRNRNPLVLNGRRGCSGGHRQRVLRNGALATLVVSNMSCPMSGSFSSVLIVRNTTGAPLREGSTSAYGSAEASDLVLMSILRRQGPFQPGALRRPSRGVRVSPYATSSKRIRPG